MKFVNKNTCAAHPLSTKKNPKPKTMTTNSKLPKPNHKQPPNRIRWKNNITRNGMMKKMKQQNHHVFALYPIAAVND